jgi:VIT1/CCC1 family predicted Fe2+/Mn2+ transporter
MNLWPSDAVSIVADLGTLAGLASSIWLTFSTRKIKSQYQRLLTLTSYANTLQQHCQALSIAIDEYAASRVVIQSELGRIQGTLKSLKADLKKDEHGTVNAVFTLVEENKNKMTVAILTQIYRELNALTVETGNMSERSKWNK